MDNHKNLDANVSKTEQMIEEIKTMEKEENRPAKRKRVVLTLEDKKNVILEREKGKSLINFLKIHTNLSN